MKIINFGNLYTSRKITSEEYSKAHEICKNDNALYINTLDKITELMFDEYYDDSIENTIRELINAGIPIDSGELSYYGDCEGRIYVRKNKKTNEIIIDTVDVQDINLYEASDETLIKILTERGYRVSKKNEAALTVPTSAGILKAFASQDPGQPGIVVMLQPAGYDCDIDMSYVSVYEDENYKTKDNERPVDVSIMTYGNVHTEDYSDKILIRREDIINAIPESELTE